MAAAPVRAATRGSALARWQATHVAELLRQHHRGLAVELVIVETEGDRRLDVPISSFGGKGVFAKEVQAAVLDGRADFAVHSAKDLPSVTVPGLRLAAMPERGEPRDGLVGRPLAHLAAGATVATGSPRRRALLAAARPDLVFEELRGNMATRLSKVPPEGAIVVAAAALQRLEVADRLVELLAPDAFVPQVGQGALAVECRAGDDATAALLAAIEHAPTRRRVDAERAYLAELGGDCDLPAGAFATLGSGPGRGPASITLSAFLAADGEPGSQLERLTEVGDDPVELGTRVARQLRAALDG